MSAPPPQAPETPTRKHLAFTARVIIGLILLNGFVAGMGAFSLWQSYNQYQTQAETNTQNLSRVLEESIAGLIDKIDLTLLTIKDKLETPASGKTDNLQIDNLLAQQLGLQDEIVSLRVTDERGLVKYGPGVQPGTNVDLSDRAFFTALRDDAKAGLMVGKPVFARISQKWVVVLARRINRRDGGFAGIVYANLDLAYLAEKFSTINIGPLGAITLRDGELNLLVRYPDPKIPGGVTGTKIVSRQLQDMISNQPDFGTYRATVKMDNIERVNAYRKVSHFPLYILVGVATQDQFLQWRHQALQMGALLGLFFLTSLLSAWAILRAWRRRLESQARLVSQESPFHTVADYTYDREYWQRTNREILYMTPSCERVTGYTREEFQKDPSLLLHLIHPDDAGQMNRHMHEIAQQDLAELDFRIVRRDGQIRWIAHHCCAVVGENGATLGRRISNRDITDRKNAELALLCLNENLEQRVQRAVAENMQNERLLIQQARVAAMGELLGNIAHQWRQPLNALALLQANILDDFEFGELSGEVMRKYTEKGQRLIQKMSHTIDDFRDFFRPRREMARFSLNTAVQQALDMVKESYQSAHIAIHFSPTLDAAVNGFANEFAQVLLNLLNNARDAIHHSNVAEGAIVIDIRRDGERAWVSVSDNGGGIAADILAKIFDPYFTTKTNSAGIGLYMSKMIMAHMGGSIEVHPFEGGVEFRLVMPLDTSTTQ